MTRHFRFLRTILAALAAAAAAAPISAAAGGVYAPPPRENSYPVNYQLSETAQHVRENEAKSGVPIAGPSFQYSEAAARTALEADAMTHPPVVRSVRTVTVDDGFDWTSAAIGGGIALVIVLASGGLAASSRRPRSAHA